MKFAALIFIAGMSMAFGETRDAQFKAATDLYNAGDFAKARNGYNTLVTQRAWSANTFYNLGNADYRLRDFGGAILNYERALAIEPNHPEARANLRLALDEARALQLPRPAWQRFVGNTTILSMSAAILGWMALFSIAHLAFVRRSAGIIAVAVIAALGCATLCAGLVYDAQNIARVAVITRADVQARLATSDNAQPILPLPPGSEVQVVERRGDWTYAQLPNGQRGWIPADAAELVRL